VRSVDDLGGILWTSSTLTGTNSESRCRHGTPEDSGSTRWPDSATAITGRILRIFVDGECSNCIAELCIRSLLSIIARTPVECPHINNRGVAVRISFLASAEQEIYHAFKFFTVFIHNFRFSSAILASWWAINLFWPYRLVALPYSGKVTEAFLSGYEMVAERMAWGGNFTPPPPSKYEG